MKSISCLLILLVALFYTNVTNAQKAWTGTITFEISAEGASLDAATKAQLPSEMKLFIADKKVKQSTISSMGTQAVIFDDETKEALILIDMMGQQMAIKSTKEEYEKGQKDQPKGKVTVMEEYKTIAGYKCKKAEITSGDDVVTVYFTEDITSASANAISNMDDLKGLALEYSMDVQGLTMKFTAKEVKAGKVAKSEFRIPSGYRELTKEEAKKMFGGE